MRDASFYDAQYFDGAGKSNYVKYSETTANFAAYADAVQALLARHGFPARGPVLELGCAKGFLVAELRRRGIEAYGVDVSTYALSQAPRDVRPYLYEGTVLSLGAQDGLYALACSFDVLEHLDELHARQALREAARVSRVQLHQVNTGHSPAVAFDGDESHVLKLSLTDWRRLAAEEGCVNTVIVETGRSEVLP